MAIYPGNLVGSERAKDMLNISSTATKVVPVLDMLINSGSQWLAGVCKRPFKYGSVTEYYDAKNSDELVLRNFPIIAITSLYYDTGRNFTSTSLLVENDDFFVDTKLGRIILIDNTFGSVRRSIKVTYTYGPSAYIIGPGNNTFAIVENSVNKNATIADGVYDPVTFAVALKAAIDLVKGAGITYTVTYSVTGEKFTITQGGSTSSLSIRSNAGGAAMVDLCKLLGFTTLADKTGALTYTSDEPSAGVDPKVRDLFIQLLQYWIRQVEFNEHGMRGINRDTGVSMLFQTDSLPATLCMMLDSMRLPISGAQYG